MLVMPVTLPPGRARFVISFVATGSPTSTMTIGMVFVAPIAARVATDVAATMRATFRCTLPARAGSRAASPAANRSSMARFFPSSSPKLAQSPPERLERGVPPSRDWPLSTPMVTGFASCCAAATTAPASNTIAMTAMKKRDGRARESRAVIRLTPTAFRMRNIVVTLARYPVGGDTASP